MLLPSIIIHYVSKNVQYNGVHSFISF